MRKSFICGVMICVMAVVCVPAWSFAQETDRQIRAKNALKDRWIGHWTAPAGYIYLADMRLEVDGENKISGAIKWTLIKSPRESELGKQGLTGVEYVKGTFDVQCGVLTFSGYNKEDANGILGLDRYRLILAENLKSLGGITYNHGNWQGSFILYRE